MVRSGRVRYTGDFQLTANTIHNNSLMLLVSCRLIATNPGPPIIILLCTILLLLSRYKAV